MQERIDNTQSSSQRAVLSGFFWKFSERILAQVISFVVSVVLARIMLPDQYGVVAMVTVFINIANVFVTSGFSTALIQKRNADETDFSTIFWCTLAVSLLLYMILFMGAPLIANFYKEPQLILVVRVFALKLIVSAYNSIQHAYVSRHMIFKKFFLSTLFGTLVSGMVGIIMAMTGCGVWALVGQYLTNSIIDTVVLGFTVPWHPRLIFSKPAAKSLMNYGWKILAADLVGTIYNNLRQLLIGRFYSTSDLAFYNKGKQIPELISTNIDTTVSTVLFPAISNQHSDLQKVKVMTRRSVSMSSYIMFPVMFGLAAIAKPLVIVLLTEKWESAAVYMQIICIAKAINTISNANIQAMKAIGKSDIVLKLEIVKKPVGILIILIALRINVFAVALSMPIYAIYAAFVNMKPNKKLLNYSICEQLRDILPGLTMAVIMFVAVSALNRVLQVNYFVTLFVDVMLGMGVYLGLSYFLKVDSFIDLVNIAKVYLRKGRKR